MERSRKGIMSFEMVYWIGRIIFLIIVITSILFLVRIYLKGNTDTEDLEMKIITNHLLYSPDSIVYYDKLTGRPMPGIIDVSKLNDETLDRAFSFGEKNMMLAAKVTLLNLDSQPVWIAFYNKVYYERWQPLAGRTGAGSVAQQSLQTYTLYSTGEILNKGMINITVLIPRS